MGSTTTSAGSEIAGITIIGYREPAPSMNISLSHMYVSSSSVNYGMAAGFWSSDPSGFNKGFNHPGAAALLEAFNKGWPTDGPYAQYKTVFNDIFERWANDPASTTTPTVNSLMNSIAAVVNATGVFKITPMDAITKGIYERNLGSVPVAAWDASQRTIFMNMETITGRESTFGYQYSFQSTLLHELLHFNGWDHNNPSNTAAFNLQLENLRIELNYPQSTNGGFFFTSSHPVVIDMDGDGVELIEYMSSNVKFDMYGDFRAEKTGWVGRDDGILAMDWNKDGVINNVLEISFSRFGISGATDMEGLLSFDTNRNWQLDASDALWSQFQIWVDRNGNGKSDKGELSSLDQLGIKSISLLREASGVPMVDGKNHVFGYSDVKFVDGRVHKAGDVMLWHDTAKTGGPAGRKWSAGDLDLVGVSSSDHPGTIH